MKIGIEVEGRLKGIPSAFINAEEFLELVHNDYCIRDLYDLVAEPSHYYISDHSGIVTLEVLSKYLDNNKALFITLEVKTIPKNRYNYPDRVKLMLHLEGIEPFDLFDGDQIKWVNSYNDVMSIGVNDMFFTDREDFNNDVVLKRK